MKSITLTFENDGKTVHKMVDGFEGKSCATATDFIEKTLGSVENVQFKNDFYIPEPVTIDQECTN